MEKARRSSEFVVNTSTTCFVCCGDVPYISSWTEGATSLGNLYQHLEVNFEGISLPELQAAMKKSGVAVSLCAECKPEMEQFSDLFETLRDCRKKMQSSLQGLNRKLMATRDRSPTVLAEHKIKLQEDPNALLYVDIVEKLRKETLMKCSSKLEQEGVPVSVRSRKEVETVNLCEVAQPPPPRKIVGIQQPQETPVAQSTNTVAQKHINRIKPVTLLPPTTTPGGASQRILSRNEATTCSPKDEQATGNQSTSGVVPQGDPVCKESQSQCTSAAATTVNLGTANNKKRKSTQSDIPSKRKTVSTKGAPSEELATKALATIMIPIVGHRVGDTPSCKICGVVYQSIPGLKAHFLKAHPQYEFSILPPQSQPPSSTRKSS